MQSKVVVGIRGKFVLRWQDESGGRWRERSTGLEANERNRSKAQQLLAQLRAELSGEEPPTVTRVSTRSQVVMPGEAPASKVDGRWDDYVVYFTKNHLAALSDGYRNVLLAVVGKFHAFAQPTYLQDITPQMVRRWITDLQEGGLAVATIHSYWGSLSAFLRVAVEDGIIKSIPKIRLPKLDRSSMSKGRALTEAEFARMLAAVDEVAPKQAEAWKFVLQGLWASGLRIGEAYRLTWGESDFYVDLERDYPCFVISAAGQKSRRRQTLPISPELAKLLQGVPERQRRGNVFSFPSRTGGRVLQAQAERMIAKFGSTAEIQVGKSKTATAHDLRRSFGSRWALKVMPQVLQQMMRHSDIQTTMRFYVDLKAQDLGEVIHAAAKEATKPSGEKSKPKRKRA